MRQRQEAVCKALKLNQYDICARLKVVSFALRILHSTILASIVTINDY